LHSFVVLYETNILSLINIFLTIFYTKKQKLPADAESDAQSRELNKADGSGGPVPELWFVPAVAGHRVTGEREHG
jgi:hypothetical protein